jgi:uncharacterized protein YihD (DUF1040 family)
MAFWQVVTLTPLGFLTDQSKEHDRIEKKPTIIAIDGYPLDFIHKDLSGLSYIEKFLYMRTYRNLHSSDNRHIFSRRVGNKLIAITIDKADLKNHLQPLEQSQIPIVGTIIPAFYESRGFKDHTLHIKKIHEGCTRLLYAYNHAPYLVRYINGGNIEKEINSTVRYIEQNYDAVPVISYDDKSSPQILDAFMYNIGSNKSWHHLRKKIVFAFLSALISLLLLCASFYLYFSGKNQYYDAVALQNRTSNLKMIWEKLPHDKSLQILQILDAFKGLKGNIKNNMWHADYVKLLSLSELTMFHDIMWRKDKNIRLLTSFDDWAQASEFKKQAERLWTGAEIKKLKHSDNYDGIVVQWQISY